MEEIAYIPLFYMSYFVVDSKILRLATKKNETGRKLDRRIVSNMRHHQLHQT